MTAADERDTDLAAPSGAVLVGGRSSRMGRDKASLDLGRGALVAVTADLLAAAGCAPVFVVGDRGPLPSGSTRVADRWPGRGPVGGIATALAHAVELGAHSVVVLACDLPDLDVTTIRSLVDVARAAPASDVIVARSDRGVEPLIALWRPTALGALVSALDACGSLAVHRVLGRLDVSEAIVAAGSIRNLNRPSDLTTAERRRLGVLSRDLAEGLPSDGPHRAGGPSR